LPPACALAFDPINVKTKPTVAAAANFIVVMNVLLSSAFADSVSRKAGT
jgi:hypothetical protein